MVTDGFTPRASDVPLSENTLRCSSPGAAAARQVLEAAGAIEVWHGRGQLRHYMGTRGW